MTLQVYTNPGSRFLLEGEGILWFSFFQGKWIRGTWDYPGHILESERERVDITIVIKQSTVEPVNPIYNGIDFRYELILNIVRCNVMMHPSYTHCREDLDELLDFCFTNELEETGTQFEERLIQHLSQNDPWPANIDPDT